MSNCKAFGLLQTRDHAIGQTPHNVLAPRSQEDLQRCAAFSTKERTTPAKRSQSVRRVRPTTSNSDDAEPKLGVPDHRIFAPSATRQLSTQPLAIQPISTQPSSSTADRSTTIRKLPGSAVIVSRAITQMRRAMTSERRIGTVTYPNAAC